MTLNKDCFIRVLTAAGISEAQMIRLHQQFEALEPAAHQLFLMALNLESDEIARIREKSRH